MRQDMKYYGTHRSEQGYSAWTFYKTLFKTIEE